VSFHTVNVAAAPMVEPDATSIEDPDRQLMMTFSGSARSDAALTTQQPRLFSDTSPQTTRIVLDNALRRRMT
jgi:hypothetical protein